MKHWLPPENSAQQRVLKLFEERYTGKPFGENFRITINFHPDRKNSVGTPILQCLQMEGVLKSQFETGTSNGGLSAYRGGDRWNWEHRAFGGIYDEAAASERPKYGALNHRRLHSGGSARFGSAHFRLGSHVRERTTYCYPDSYFGPETFGVGDRVSGLIEHADSDNRDELDAYIEAHIHGPLVLEDDVEAIVLDPVFRGTDIDYQARELPCRLEWHRGFRLSIDELECHKNYRGEAIVRIARQLGFEILDPLIIGQAIEFGHHDSQDIKKVWHYLARFGDLNKQAEQDAVGNGASAP